jgi:hypothetical protein
MPVNCQKRGRQKEKELLQRKSDISRAVFCFFLLTLIHWPAGALTTFQSSTSAGYFRDLGQNAHYPVYLSGSMRGLYSSGYQTGVDFVLNNDFALNQWVFYPTKASVTYGSLQSSYLLAGRDMFAEGFDMALLDGVQSEINFGTQSGVFTYAGWLKPSDFADPNAIVPLVGVTGHTNWLGVDWRLGASGRNEAYKTGLATASGFTVFENLPLQPALLHKTEASLNAGGMNQSLTDLSLNLTSNIALDLNHSYRTPRSTDYRVRDSLLYRVFAVSASETIGGGISFVPDRDSVFQLNGRQIQYNSGFRGEIAQEQDLGADLPFTSKTRIAPILTHIASYGGELWAGGFRFTWMTSEESLFRVEGDAGYLSKVTGMSGWIGHGRVSYELPLFSQVKGWFSTEVERNQYFSFDVRAMTYVTTYM